MATTIADPRSTGSGIAHFDDLRAVAASGRIFLTIQRVYDSGDTTSLAAQVRSAIDWISGDDASTAQPAASSVRVTTAGLGQWPCADLSAPNIGLSLADGLAFIAELDDLGAQLDARHTEYEQSFLGE